MSKKNKKDFNNSSSSSRKGLVFESNIIVSAMMKLGRNDIRKASLEEDHSKGTDLFYKNVPIDVTCKPIDIKDHTTIIGTYYTGKMVNDKKVLVYYGVRSGNNVHMFDKEVLVVSILTQKDMAGVLKIVEEDIVNIFEKGVEKYIKH